MNRAFLSLTIAACALGSGASPAAPPASAPAPASTTKAAAHPARTDLVFNLEASDGTPLEAKLTTPTGLEEPAPVVFYLHGAGPRSYDNPFGYVDESGKRQVRFFLDSLAEGLAERGVAFCRMSKRGCHALTEPPWMRLDREVFSRATMSVLLDDYERGLAALRERPEIDPRRIVLLGSSEGTRLAPQLALRSPDGIAGVVMMGFAADNARDTVVWQLTAGPWRNVQHAIPAARDGALTKEEHTEATAANPALAQAIRFEAFDTNADGVATEAELTALVRPRLDLILKAVEERDDDFLWANLLNLSSAYLLDWWDAEPTHATLAQVDAPLAIFHGGLDGTCRVEGAHEAEAALRAAGRNNLMVKVYPTADHSLDWTWQAARDGGPDPYRDVYDHVAGLVGGAPQR